MADLRNEFSWSWSRHRAFGDCYRKYWLQHYAFWGGWDPTSAPAVREIYIQKRLTSRGMWLGTLVHEAAEFVLGQVRHGRFPPPEWVAERTARRGRRQIDDSRRGLYRLDPKGHPGFVEHYYGETVPEEGWEQVVEEAVRQVRGLFENPVFLRLTAVASRIREVEELHQVQIDGVPVWVALDVLVQDEHGNWVIIDWKTGRRHEADGVAAQIGIYGLHVMNRWMRLQWSAEPGEGRIRSMYVNLRDGTRDVRVLGRTEIAEAASFVVDSAHRMRGRLRNAPENAGVIEDFPMLPEGAPNCRWCPYRRTCGR